MRKFEDYSDEEVGKLVKSMYKGAPEEFKTHSIPSPKEIANLFEALDEHESKSQYSESRILTDKEIDDLLSIVSEVGKKHLGAGKKVHTSILSQEEIDMLIGALLRQRKLEEQDRMTYANYNNIQNLHKEITNILDKAKKDIDAIFERLSYDEDDLK